MNKKEQRKEALKARRALSAQQRNVFSHKIAEKLMALPQFMKAKTVFCYCPLEEEVDTAEIIEACLSGGKALYVPKVLSKTEMGAVRYSANMEKNEFGIYEPADMPEEVIIDFAVIPGVCFDERGARIGFGGGYYDRFLQPETFKAGVAFSCQMCTAIEAEPHDVRMDAVVTESILYNFKETV